MHMQTKAELDEQQYPDIKKATMTCKAISV